MKIEDYKLGQKVSLYGRIEAIDIADIHNKENTTILSIKTVTGKISVNPKWEEVRLDLVQPEIEVPQFIADYIESCISSSSGLIWSIRPERAANELCRLTYDWLFPNGHRLEDGSFPDPFEPDNLVRPDSKNQLKFVQAWLAYPNITVEKEKLYQIIDKRLDVTFNCLGYAIEDGVWFWANKKSFLSDENVRLDHTKQQLIDAGFEEVFENPNYEAKEVTE